MDRFIYPLSIAFFPLAPAEYAAAVILPVKAILPAQLKAPFVAVPLSEFTCEKTHTVFFRHLRAYAVYPYRVLHRAYGKGGGKPREAVFRSVFRGLLEAQLIARGAALALLRLLLKPPCSSIELRRVVFRLN